MSELTDDTIRDAWEWLPHGEYGSGHPLFVNYRGAKVNDAHRMAALAGIRWVAEWGNEICEAHGWSHPKRHRDCPYCWTILQGGER